MKILWSALLHRATIIKQIRIHHEPEFELRQLTHKRSKLFSGLRRQWKPVFCYTNTAGKNQHNYNCTKYIRVMFSDVDILLDFVFSSSNWFVLVAFSALTLLVGHPACKKWVMSSWCSYLSGARCKRFAYGPADANATPLSLAPVKTTVVKEAVKQMSDCLTGVYNN